MEARRFDAGRTASRAVPVWFLCLGSNGAAAIHVRRDRRKAKFWLVPVARLSKNEGFADHELNEIRKAVIEHRAFFVEKWHEFFGQ
jgi:hypothetical protein